MAFTRRYKFYLVIVFILIAGGFAVFIYGFNGLPTTVPDDFEPLPQMNFNPTAEERQMIQTRMIRYQYQSFPFKICMIGVGCCIGGFLLLCLSRYCCQVNTISPEEHRAIALQVTKVTPTRKQERHLEQPV